MTIRRPAGLAMAAALLWLPALTAYADPEDVDDTFGIDGVATGDAGDPADISQGVIVGADFIYVLANGGSILRFTPKGVLDTEFGNGGVLRFDDVNFTVTAIGEDPAGGLFLGGNRFSNVAVTRINFDGTIDPNFANNTAGFSVINTPGDGLVRYIRFFELKVVVIGTTATRDGDFRDAFIARIQQNGDPDFGWGFDGVALVNFGTPCDEASYFSVDRDRNTLVFGDTSFGDCATQDLGLAKVNSIGVLDASLGDTGIKVLNLGGKEMSGVVVSQTDTGKIAFSALSQNTSTGVVSQVIGRLTPTGTFDPSFNGNGRIIAPLPNIPGFTYNLTSGVQSQGQLVYAGNFAGGDVAVARLEGTPQLSIDDVPSSSGNGTNDDGSGGGTTLSGNGGGGSFGWVTLAILGFLGGLRRWKASRA